LPDVGGRLVADVFIGYPPPPPEDPAARRGHGSATKGGKGGKGGDAGELPRREKPNKYDEFMDDAPRGATSKPPRGGGSPSGGGHGPMSPVGGSPAKPSHPGTPSGSRLGVSPLEARRGGSGDDRGDGDESDGDGDGDESDGASLGSAASPVDVLALDLTTALRDSGGLLVPINGLASFGPSAVASFEPTQTPAAVVARQAPTRATKRVTDGGSVASSASESSWTLSTGKQAKQARRGCSS
jgi:hypothetical protein